MRFIVSRNLDTFVCFYKTVKQFDVMDEGFVSVFLDTDERIDEIESKYGLHMLILSHTSEKSIPLQDA